MNVDFFKSTFVFLEGEMSRLDAQTEGILFPFRVGPILRIQGRKNRKNNEPGSENNDAAQQGLFF